MNKSGCFKGSRFLHTVLIDNKKTADNNRLSFGWGAGIRTPEMLESESSALPLGYTPVFGWDSGI